MKELAWVTVTVTVRVRYEVEMLLDEDWDLRFGAKYLGLRGGDGRFKEAAHANEDKRQHDRAEVPPSEARTTIKTITD